VTAVLFLGASVSQVAALRRARDLGIRFVASDGDPHAPTNAVSVDADRRGCIVTAAADARESIELEHHKAQKLKIEVQSRSSETR
jgi:hypothetical protein